MVIDKQFFVCYPESPSHVTYRARLEATSEKESGSLISLIEEWVRGGASVIVTGVLMTVDTDYSVAISSLNEGECSPNVAGDKNSDDGGNNTAIITGAVVAIVLIIVTIVVIVFLVAKRCRRELPLRESDTMFVLLLHYTMFYYYFALSYENTVVGKSAVTTITNNNYCNVKVDERYKLPNISSHPSSLPLPSSAAVAQFWEEETEYYDVIPED